MRLVEEETTNVDTAEGRATEAINFIKDLYFKAKQFPADASQFSMTDEKRKWQNFREKAKVGQDTDIPGSYSVRCVIDEFTYNLLIEFSAKICGQEEKDVPEPGVHDEGAAVKLKKIELRRVKVSGPEIEYNSPEPSGALKEAALTFLEQILITDYDIKGSEIYSLQKTQ